MNQTPLSAIFKAYDVRGKVGTELSSEVAKNIGRALADYLPTEGVVAVGRDMRPDSMELCQNVIAGLTQQGRDVIDLGMITSDMSYFAVGKYNLAGAAMVTASHNPGEYNGIKLYCDQVIAVGLDSGLDIIRDAVLKDSFIKSSKKGNVSKKDITKDWISHALSFLGGTRLNYKIAIDAGNGMAGKILPVLESELPLSITPLFWELDGTFPNHEANPQKPENLKDLIDVVLKEKLDFGVAFDGDGDRAGFVDDKGRVVAGTDLITIVAKLYLDKFPGSEIVHEVRTSRATREHIENWGGTPYRTKAGRVSIGTIMRERKAPFGGETTGHLFFKENYYADSGLIAALMVMKALAESGKKLSELVDEYHIYTTTPEINFEVNDKDSAIKSVREMFLEAKEDWLDGLSLEFANGSWLNLRASNTEPLLRLNAEAPTEQELYTLIKKVTSVLES